MGGRIFESKTRTVTGDDVSEVCGLFKDYLKDTGSSVKVIGSWNNRKARGSETSGDLDVLIYTSYLRPQFGYSSLDSRANHRSSNLAMSALKNIQELKEESDSLTFIRRNDIQIDLHVVSSKPLFDWISEATTVPETDVYKPLYRNEILFQLPRYLSGRKIKLSPTHQVLEYTRERFTLWEGLMTSTYSFEGKTGNTLKSPKRSDYRLSTNFRNFLTEDCRFPEWVAEMPTFLNLMASLKTEPFYRTLCEDLRASFVRKKVPCPNLISE